MKSILGIGNALTDILAVLPDDTLLKKYNLPLGSMQHVDATTGNTIWSDLKEIGVQYVAGGSAANTVSATAILGMPSGYIGKVGNDELGSLFRQSQLQNGIKSNLLVGTVASGRAMVFITAPNADRTFATYLGAALELEPDDLKPEYFAGYDYLHIEGYLVQNQNLVRRAVELGRQHNMIISLDMASYNVVESNLVFLQDIVKNYVDIIFANETEAAAFTHLPPRQALLAMSEMVDTAIVKIGKEGSMIQRGDEYHFIDPWPGEAVDATGAGDTYAAGFLFAHAQGMPLKTCGEVGSALAAKVVEIIGTKIDIPRWKAAKTEIRRLMGISE